MPRFFFDVRYGSRTYRDGEGQELPDTAEVRREAMRALPEIAFGRIPSGDDAQEFTVTARDEHDRTVYTATLSYVGRWPDKVGST